MMNQFETWLMQGQRWLVVADPAHGYDFWMGFYRKVAVLP